MNSNLKVKRTSKFIREYGKTLKEMSYQYGYTIHYLWSLHLQSKLHDFIIKEKQKEDSG